MLGALIIPAAGGDGSEWNIIGRYNIYGARLGDTTEPTKKDAKVAFEFYGKTARDLYAHLPDAGVDECGFRIRGKGNLKCWKVFGTREVSCSLGFDLKTGKTTYGTIC